MKDMMELENQDDCFFESDIVVVDFVVVVVSLDRYVDFVVWVLVVFIDGVIVVVLINILFGGLS